MTRSTPADRLRCSRMALGAAWVLVCSLVGAPAARAQGPQPGPTRPFHALFGGVEGNPASTQLFDLNVSVSGQSSDSATPLGVVRSPGEGAADPWFSGSMFYSGLSAQASYMRRWSRAALSASTGHGVYYYPGSGEFLDASHSVDVGFNAMLSQRLALRATQSLSYSPFYGLDMFPGREAAAALTWNPLYSVSMQRNLQMATIADLSARLTRRVSFNIGYDRRTLQFTEQHRSFTSQSAGGRLEVRLARGLSMRAGYREHMGDVGTIYTAGAVVAQHDIDAGIDLNRSLSLTRRTTFGFNTGSTIYSTAFHSYYRFLVNANLDVGMGRSWSTRVEFRHGLQWIQGFPEPVFSDIVSVGTSGYASRRVQILFDAGYSRGEPGLSPGLAKLQTYTGRTQMRVALSRFAALSVNYFYYHYAFDPGFPLPPGMSRAFDRQSVRAGVDLWAPLLR